MPKTEKKFAPLIVGLPRTGFSLTASVLIHIFNIVPNKFGPKQQCLKYFCETIGTLFKERLYSRAKRLGIYDKLLFNENFANLAGGPIWNNDELGQKAYFRKYIGINGLGDFTLLTSHPIEILDQYEIVHSHGPFSSWLEQTPYADYTRFASYRNPAGVVNSACHSINALASEYLQRTKMVETDAEIRTKLATYKLSDEKFFRALLNPLMRGYRDQIENWDSFIQVEWEKLVTSPREEIAKIANSADIVLTDEQLEMIWSAIGFRNLTGAHKHNYRKGFVGDEYNTLTNEHIEIMTELGFDEIFEKLGYEKLSFKMSEYNEFQKSISNALEKGQPIDPLEDRILFDLAFNKSNIDFEGFNFRQYDWKRHSKLERSNIEDEFFELKLWEEAEDTLSLINLMLNQLIQILRNGDDPENFCNLIRNFSNEFSFLPLNSVTKNFDHLIRSSHASK